MTPETILRALLLASLTVAAPGQDPVADGAALLLDDGTFLRGQPVALDPDDGVLRWRSPGDGGQVEALDWTRVVALHGTRARAPTAGAVVRLVGGDELRGELRGGDAAGETVVVRSGVLGDRPVRIDRIASIVLLGRVDDPRSATFAVPDDVDEDEVLFVPARRGYDLVVGLVHGFRPDGILFEARGDAAPRLRPYASLAGFALRGGEPPGTAADALLTTVSGDRVGVRRPACDDGGFTFDLEDGATVRVPWRAVASLTPRVDGRVFLSDLPVIEARERSYFEDGDLPLWPYHLDRAVTGSPLAAGGLGFGKGIGVHAESVLAWRVPDGARTLVGLVAVDDSALDLPVRGAVAVTVLLGDRVLFQVDELAAGDAPRSLGALPVEPGATLRLKVGFGPGLDLGDRVDWLDVAFLR